MEYIIPFLLVIIFAVCGILFLNVFITKVDGKDIKIIIDGNAPAETLEMLVVSAKSVSENKLYKARVYIDGGDEFFVDLLCKRYGINKL